MKDLHEYVGEWIMKAQSDLKIAMHEVGSDDPATDATCFHCQQFAEKMLKAWLIAREVEYPLTHNLETLFNACESLDPSFEEIRGIHALTPYAVEIRYADNFYFPTRDEMIRAVDLARKAGIFIKSRLEAIGYVCEIRFIS